ncbi:MAG: dihydrofolate reductase [Pseudomonadota bacterium]
MTMRLALVVAVAKNGVIGANGTLAWRIRDDMKWFKSVTNNKPMIMGRKTFDSIGKPLPGRDSIVLTRNPSFCEAGVFITRSVRGALRLGAELASTRDEEEVCVIGGGDIYAQTIIRADRIYLTRVDADVEGDVLFPPLDSRQWTQERRSECEKNDRNEFACEFFILERRR